MPSEIKSTEKKYHFLFEKEAAEHLAEVERAANIFDEKYLKSPKAALAALVEMGIYDKNGELTKEYGG